MFRRELRIKINDHFNKSELRTLAFDLGLDWEELAGEEFSIKCQSLIGAAQRNGRMPELLEILKQVRPHVNWPTLSQKTSTLPLQEEDPIRTAVWNALYESIWSKKSFLNPTKTRGPLIDDFSFRLWSDSINKPVDNRPKDREQILKEIRRYFFTYEETQFYSFLEYILNYWTRVKYYKPDPIHQKVNKALISVNAGVVYEPEYEFPGRIFVNGTLRPLPPSIS